MVRRKLLVLALAAALGAAWAPPAQADLQPGPVVFGGPGSYLSTYTTPVAVVEVGGPLTLVHADIQLHDVVSGTSRATTIGPDRPWCNDPEGIGTIFAPGTCPLFWSPLIGLAETTKVWGTESLQPGQTYDFYCSIHPLMFGKLVAVGTGY